MGRQRIKNESVKENVVLIIGVQGSWFFLLWAGHFVHSMIHKNEIPFT
jgi:hypothetical protein